MEFYGNLVNLCWQKNQRNFVSPQIKPFHNQCNTLRRLTYYKQSYWKKYSNLYDAWHSWRIDLGKESELPSWKLFCNIKYFWLEDICFKQWIDDISPKQKFFSHFSPSAIKIFHTKFTIIDIFTSVSEFWISVDTLNLPKV